MLPRVEMGGLAHQPPDSFPLHLPTRVENSEAVKEATVHRDSGEHLKIAKERARIKASPREKYICCLQHIDTLYKTNTEKKYMRHIYTL